jgi:hypothetical protein
VLYEKSALIYVEFMDLQVAGERGKVSRKKAQKSQIFF